MAVVFPRPDGPINAVTSPVSPCIRAAAWKRCNFTIWCLMSSSVTIEVKSRAANDGSSAVTRRIAASTRPSVAGASVGARTIRTSPWGSWRPVSPGRKGSQSIQEARKESMS